MDAVLNGTAAVLLVIARVLIGRRQIRAHKWVMISAVATSCVFLVNYLTYHAMVGSKHFIGQGWIRPVYFSILTSHTILAAAIVPLVLITLSRGLKRSDVRHRAIARWTFMKCIGPICRAWVGVACARCRRCTSCSFI